MKKKVVIIGGGAIGALSAYYLNHRGFDVTLVDKDRIGAGASHGNCGLILPHILPVNMPGVPLMAAKWMLKPDSPFYVSPKTLLKYPSWFINFLRNCTRQSMLAVLKAQTSLIEHAVENFDTIIKSEKMACDWDVKGFLEVFESIDKLDLYEKDVELDRQCGAVVKRLSKRELLVKEPYLSSKVAGAWYYPKAGHLRPDLFMKQIKKVLLKKGVEIIEQASFETFQVSNGKAEHAVIKHKKIKADYFIMATGAWTSLYRKQLKQTVSIQPGKGYSCTFLTDTVPINTPCILAEKKVVITPMKKAIRLGGTMEFSGFDNQFNRKRLNAILDSGIPYLKEMVPEIREEEWCGWRPMTYDGLPYIDFLPELKNVVVAAGHNMAGISMAPGTGKLVADFIERGKSTLTPNPFGFNRI